MLMKEINGLDVAILKQYELILAFHAVLLLKNSEYRDNPQLTEAFDFIETPNNSYMQELVKLIDVNKYPEICKYILNFSDCSVSVNIAVGMNDNYDIDDAKFDYDYCQKYIEYGTVKGFAREIKKLAKDINWDEFLIKHENVYRNFVNTVCNFPSKLDLNDIGKFYHISKKHYIYSPSMFMNGGFGVSDKLNNLYYFRGFIYNSKEAKFEYDSKYLLECLFHEFSHPIINPFVNEYLSDLEILDKFHEMSVKNNLPTTYAGNKETVMYEYLVRANAYILANKYFDMPRTLEGTWITEHGFQYLIELIEFTQKNLPMYSNYEEFVKEAIPNFMDLCLKYDKENINKKDK